MQEEKTKKPKEYTIKMPVNLEVGEARGEQYQRRPMTAEDFWTMMYELQRRFDERDKKSEEEWQKQRQETRELKKMFQETKIMFQETKIMFQETDKKFQETDKKFQETDKKIERIIMKTSKENEKATRSIDRLAKIAGGLGVNLGEVAEDYFIGALESRNELAGIQYHEIICKESRGNGIRGEYDIILINNKVIIIVEVKQKLVSSDISDFHDRRMPKFRTLFPEYAKRQLMGAMAALTLSNKTAEKAFDLGYFVLTQAGQQLKLLNPKGFVPKTY